MQGKVFAKSLTDHPYYKGIEGESLYLMDDGTWMYQDGVRQRLYSVTLVRLDYDNLGVPFRGLCELTMDTRGTLANSRIYMVLSKSDGEKVWGTGVPGTESLMRHYKWNEELDITGQN